MSETEAIDAIQERWQDWLDASPDLYQARDMKTVLDASLALREENRRLQARLDALLTAAEALERESFSSFYAGYDTALASLRAAIARAREEKP